MMPDSLFTASIVTRAALLWAGIRILIAVSGLPAGRVLLPTGLGESVIIVAATVLVAAVELHRRNEFLLLGSLGHAPAVLLLLSALPVLPLELLFSVTAR